MHSDDCIDPVARAEIRSRTRGNPLRLFDVDVATPTDLERLEASIESAMKQGYVSLNVIKSIDLHRIAIEIKVDWLRVEATFAPNGQLIRPDLPAMRAVLPALGLEM